MERNSARAVSQAAPQLRLRFSAGLALCLGQEGTDATLERADQALYQAKSAGRHRSVVAAGPEQDI